MQLIIAVVGEDDADQVVEALVEQEFRTTRINTAGGFFKKGNATLLIGVEEDRARRIAREACEKATVTIAAERPKAELRPLIRHLCANGQLTAGLVLRALLSGNIALFEEALAELSGLPQKRVSALLHDRFGSGLQPLLEKAELPAAMHPAFKEAVKAMRDGLVDQTQDARLQRRVVERVLAACESADPSDVAPLITLLRRFASEAARDEARLFCDDELAAEPLALAYSEAA